jgi:nucleotide-binding universal stress UspA family protein
VLRRFDWFVDTYVSDPRSLTSSALPATSKARSCPRRQQKLDAFQKKYLGDTRIANTTVVSGTHYKQILSYVKSEGIDLIIMGMGTPVQKVMFGSVAEKVSKLADVPVMLVK